MKYDWQNFTRYPAWSHGRTQHGALLITNHPHICALMVVPQQSFTLEVYNHRVGIRGEPRYNVRGEKLDPFPKLTKQEIMKLDMDYLMSCIHCPNGPEHGWAVEMFTNDREDPEWLALVKDCPYAKLVYEIPSRMGPYKIQCWLFRRDHAKGV